MDRQINFVYWLLISVLYLNFNCLGLLPPISVLSKVTNDQTNNEKLFEPMRKFMYSSSDDIVTDPRKAVFSNPFSLNEPRYQEYDDDKLVTDYILQFSANRNNSCMLSGVKEHMMAWAYENGSLVVSNLSRGAKDAIRFLDASHRINLTDAILLTEIYRLFKLHSSRIIAFSAAFSGLTQVPFNALFEIRETLQFLTLKGSNFSSHRIDMKSIQRDNNIKWAKFPEMQALTELDISDCMIEHISAPMFANITNLTTLYISNNPILRIPSTVFEHIPKLRYLDLSNLNSMEADSTPSLSSIDQIIKLVWGIRIDQHAFKTLPQLEYLDLSYTKISRTSVVTFNFLGPRLKYLSLCFTNFPNLEKSMFKNTSLRGLDMSGNSYTGYDMAEDSLDAVAHSLQFLFFEQSNLKDLSWLNKLSNLVVVNLNTNNINQLPSDVFSNLTHLNVLDLSSNHIGNWYHRIFTNNKNLKILNLRDNNINIITSEMLLDFQDLHYLGIGDNNFVCDCVLRDLIDIATVNNNKASCVDRIFSNTRSLIQNNIRSNEGSSNSQPNVEYMASLRKYIPMLNRSYLNLRKQMKKHKLFNFQIAADHYKDLSTNPCPNIDHITIYDKINGSTLKFQLLDYETEHYWCFNETLKTGFFELNCEPRGFYEAISIQIRHVTKYVTIIPCTIILLSIVVFVIYLKRWHIHYYYSSLKSATLLAIAAQENNEKFKDLSESDSNLIYDIFISYCERDREWVLEQLLPNLEMAGDMSLCMHERDFQVGLTILDNIISCMDRSRCLMLVVSANFLLSHWCQFEMRLAQHRLFEASKEHVILVFLEDIPKRKRPKTLQYLMEVKTYINWPSKDSNERKLFWKRLGKSIKNICRKGVSKS